MRFTILAVMLISVLLLPVNVAEAGKKARKSKSYSDPMKNVPKRGSGIDGWGMDEWDGKVERWWEEDCKGSDCEKGKAPGKDPDTGVPECKGPDCGDEEKPVEGNGDTCKGAACDCATAKECTAEVLKNGAVTTP